MRYAQRPFYRKAAADFPLWASRAGKKQLLNVRVDWRGKGHLLLASGGNRQVGGDNIPFTFVKRADELVAGNRHKDDTDLKMTMFELFLLRQALIQARSNSIKIS
jgi:hypothetical protein